MKKKVRRRQQKNEQLLSMPRIKMSTSELTQKSHFYKTLYVYMHMYILISSRLPLFFAYLDKTYKYALLLLETYAVATRTLWNQLRLVTLTHTVFTLNIRTYTLTIHECYHAVRKSHLSYIAITYPVCYMILCDYISSFTHHI